MTGNRDIIDEKWRQFLGLVKNFRHIPFADFVLASGSLVFGNLHEKSDFDVIIGVKYGRIFTARFLCKLFFGFHNKKTPDKICLNHFVTEKSYRLSPPYNFYWKKLYQNLVPVYGPPQKIGAFFKANSWIGKPSSLFKLDSRHFYGASGIKAFLEKMLAGQAGDFLEKILKFIQEKKHKNSKDATYKPRVIFTEAELELHPDTKRTEGLTRF